MKAVVLLEALDTQGFVSTVILYMCASVFSCPAEMTL